MIDQIEKAVTSTPPHQMNGGIWAKFVKVTDEWGFKFYRDSYKRDITYEKQAHAFTFGLAPALGEKVEMFVPDMGNVYGYLTQIAELPIERVCRELGIPKEQYYNLDYDDDFYDKANDLIHDYAEGDDYLELREKLQDAGIGMGDMHDGNIGWLPDGTFVMIDFSHNGD